ncbi:MAG: DUF4340 domain-containing protein [Calditrichaeota bacterium]|nr:DUF4340 domain-containing protein [Calditrichota bacterium]MCB9366745.1 DUF4340 domain-containing protein [Calditrichota bacterium]
MNRALVLIVILAALIGVYWLVDKNEPVAKTNVPLVQADSASITYLKIESTSDTVELRKEGDGWKVAGAKPYPANEQNVGRALAKFSQMTRKALITDKPERFEEFEVDGDKSVHVTFTSKGKEQTIHLGKAGPSFQTSYARVDGDDDVWEVGGNHSSTFRRPEADWRDKTITQFPVDSVSKLTVTFPGSQLIFSRPDSVWAASENGTGFTASKTQIERATRLLSRMSTVEFADTLSDSLFEAPECALIVELRDGSTTELKLVKRDDKQFYLRKTGAASDFVIYNSTAEVLMRKKDEYLEKTAPAS